MRLARFLVIALILQQPFVLAQTYNYDAGGRLTRATYPNGVALSYVYDAADNLISVANLSVPATPSAVTAVRVSPNEIRISWQTTATGLTDFVIQRRPASGGDWQDIATVIGTARQFIDSTASPSIEYMYRLAARSGIGSSSYSSDALVTSSTTVPLNIDSRGARSLSTLGTAGTVSAGYATVDIDGGSTPYGTAVFRVRQNGTIVSEAGVPASPPALKSRIFIEYRAGLSSASNHFSGRIDVNTGFAIVNRGNRMATVTFTLNRADGVAMGSGTATLQKGAHAARFISELPAFAPGFVLPSNFATATGFATLDIQSDQPLSTMALRMTINQRGETLFTSTPVTDLSVEADSAPVYFPQFVDGGGYTTALMLVNTSLDSSQGTLDLFDSNGSPLQVTPVGGSAGSSFAYAIAAGGFVVFETSGSASNVRAGWARWTAAPGRRSPAGAGVFRLAQAGIVVSESGIPAAMPTTRARIYVDKSTGRDTGIAVANPTGAAAAIIVNVFQIDGTTPAGSSAATVDLGLNGHRARFAGELIPGLPTGFTGVLDLTSGNPFVALTLRLTTNSRNEALLTTLPVADQTSAAPSPLVFPQIADGGGYETELIFAGTANASAVIVRFFDGTGAPMPVGRLP